MTTAMQFNEERVTSASAAIKAVAAGTEQLETIPAAQFAQPAPTALEVSEAISGAVPQPHPEVPPVERRKSQRKSGLKSVWIVSLCIFGLLNLVLAFDSPFHFDAFRYKYKGWSWWVFNDLKNSKTMHNVALLGSSLMVSANATADANFKNESLDLTQHHRAEYFDSKLRTRFSGEFNTFNLAGPGQMPSDAYMTLRAMVNTSQRPEVVIYGVAPRDFLDSTMQGPADTEPFGYLRRLVDIEEAASGFFRTPYARLEWFLQKHIYLFGYALDFQLNTIELLQKALDIVVPKPFNNPSFTWWDRVRLMPLYLPGEFHESATLSPPMTREQAKAKFVNNAREYLERYKKPDPHTYKTQYYFLRKLAQFCKRERIELVLVNMPITLQNINLLGYPKYLEFVQNLKIFGVEQNVPFYDICNWNDFEQGDYTDSVHLNGYGGTKFFNRLTDRMAADPRVAPAMVLAGKELERHQQVAGTRLPM